MELERRAASAEVRAAGRRLEGYAAVFNVEARIGSFVETIAPGAFAASLASGADILALADHDAGKLLARTRSGTLTLREDAHGLSFVIEMPSTGLGRDVLELAARGDVGGMSFGFNVRPDGESWNGNRRELRAIDLAEISVILAWPAYPETSVSVRNRPSAAAPETGLRRVLAQWRA